MKAEILKMLRESDEFVSGQQICDKFGVSRTAVWKSIRQLKEEGYEVEAVRNRGYRLLGEQDVLSEEEIRSRMKTEWAGSHIVYYESTDSTNIRAKQLGDNGACHGTLVVSSCQTAGRGRRGKVWESPDTGNIYMTILLRPKFAPAKAPMLTLVMAYSVVLALRECIGLDVQIKWPNDIVLNGKKIVGILTEMNSEIDYIHYVVIGTGINANLEVFPEEIRGTASSLLLESGHAVQRSSLVASVMKHFERTYEIFEKTEDLSGIREEYNRMLVNCGREVRILEQKETWEATALGINDSGELIVRKADGTEKEVFAGEVSVRGIYGYV